MSRVIYVNGRYCRYGEALVHVEDRGYQFADSVYEVCEVRDGRLIDERRHLARLDRSLREIAIRQPMSLAALRVVMREVVRRNRVHEGLVYMQVSRGVAPRDHAFPSASVSPSLVVTARSIDPKRVAVRFEEGVGVITLPDERWKRVDIKTTSLLPNLLAKQKAKEAGAFEAWLVDDEGYVTEGSSTNAWIVTGEGVLVTRSAEARILRGVTRGVVRDFAPRHRLTVEERPFTVAEALAASEAFLTSASNPAVPIVRIDGQPVGSGRPGPVAQALRRLYHSEAESAPLWASGGPNSPKIETTTW